MAHTYNIKYYKVKLLKFDTIQIMQQVTYNFELVEWYRFGWETALSQKTFDERYEIIEELKL